MNKTLLSYLLILGIAGVTGAGTGVILKRTIGPIDEVYPPGFNPDEYKADPSALLQKYISGGEKTTGFSDSDLVNIGLEKYRTMDYCYSIGIGTADAGITVQSIRNAQVKNNNRYFEEQISSGMVGVAKRSYQEDVDSDIKLYSGSPTSVTSADYSSESTYSKAGYKDYLGKSLDEMFIYIISDKTTLKSSKKSLTGGGLEISLVLDNNISTYYYKTQMKSISGLSNLPPFTDVSLRFTFGANLVLEKLFVDETYTATKEGIPVPAKTHNLITNYYYAGVEKEIPTVDQNFDYTIIEEA